MNNTEYEMLTKEQIFEWSEQLLVYTNQLEIKNADLEHQVENLEGDYDAGYSDGRSEAEDSKYEKGYEAGYEAAMNEAELHHGL